MNIKEQLAWASGIFEGEGSIVRLGKSNRWGLRIAMTDGDIIARVLEAFRVGRVYGPYHQPNSHNNGKLYKDYFVWTVNNRVDFEIVAKMMSPWLGNRRKEKLDEALSGWTTVKPRHKRTEAEYSPRPNMIKRHG